VRPDLHYSPELFLRELEVLQAVGRTRHAAAGHDLDVPRALAVAAQLEMEIKV